MRISHQSVAQRLLREISIGQAALFETQERLASGKAISKPSDDPFGLSRTLAARTDLDLGSQWQRNITVAEDDLGLSESLLTNLSDLLQRSQELATQGANGALTADAREQIALEVSRLLDEAVAIGNSSFGGRYLFGGHQTGTPPFVEDVPGDPTVVNYVGDAGTVEREIGPGGERIQVNIVGSDLFSGIYTTLIQLRDDLNANNQTAVNAASGAVSADLHRVIEFRGDIGAKMRQAGVARDRLEDGELRLRSLIAGFEEADLAESLVDLQMRDTALNAALGAAARTLNTSLLDFLR
jgi:flagellar hook-associated protein 3 FlgL